MRVICAPDSFKESLSAAEAAAAMARGVGRAAPDAHVDVCPIADGGEGTVAAMVEATGGEYRDSIVTGPVGEPVRAVWGMLGDGDTAVIELAAAAGLALTPPDRRDPQRTTSFGVGELIDAAVRVGARRIVLGIGGSATCDGGCGAAQALGVRFHLADRIADRPLTGGMLGDITAAHDRFDRVPIDVACDVTNPLLGPTGAARVYGPQKGATPGQVEQLERGLSHLADLLGVDPDMPGAGAAGGFGYGAVALLGARLRRGIDLVLEAVDFDRRVRGCDLCLVGEGRLDGQTLSGKAMAGVASAAKSRGATVIALVGEVGPGGDRAREIGIDHCLAIGPGLPRSESMRRAADLLEDAAAAAVGLVMSRRG